MTDNKQPKRKGKQLGLFFTDDISDKVRYIAWYKRKKMTGYITSVFEKEIKDFEGEHGAITPEQIEQAKEK